MYIHAVTHAEKCKKKLHPHPCDGSTSYTLGIAYRVSTSKKKSLRKMRITSSDSSMTFR